MQREAGETCPASMTNSLLLDLHERWVASVDERMLFWQAAERFGIGAARASRVLS